MPKSKSWTKSFNFARSEVKIELSGRGRVFHVQRATVMAESFFPQGKGELGSHLSGR